MAVFFINVVSQSLQATFYLYPDTIAKYRRQFYQIRPFVRTLKSNPEHLLDTTQNYHTTANNFAMYYAENATAFHTANIQQAFPTKYSFTQCINSFYRCTTSHTITPYLPNVLIDPQQSVRQSFHPILHHQPKYHPTYIMLI